MQSKKVSILLITLFTFFIFSIIPVARAETITVEGLSNELMCTCDCSMVLVNCDCVTAKEMKSEIQERINQGKTKKQITSDFHTTYGDIVLTTSQKIDLELFLWIFPIIAVVAGTLFIYQLARRKAPYTSEVGAPITNPEAEEVEREVLDAEMARYEEIFHEEFRKFKEERDRK